MDIPDGDLVRLARDGDPAAFRLLVERHLPMARARAARLCPQPDDADDAVQESFLQAFIALGLLRDPDRFAWPGRHPRQRLPRPAAPRAADPARRLAREPAPGLRRQPAVG